MYLNNMLGSLGSLEGSGANGDWTASGPGLSVTDNGDGTRRVQFRPGVVASRVPVKNHLHLARECGDPRGASVGIFPGVLQCGDGFAFSLVPGKTWQGPRLMTEGVNLSVPAITFKNLPPEYWPDGWYEQYGPQPEWRDARGSWSIEQLLAVMPPFNGHGCFGTAGGGGDVQGPCSGDPDSYRTLPGDGSPNPLYAPRGSGGYATGTQTAPYLPWKDPNSPFYGHPVLVEPVAPQLPPTHDPWEPVPPVVNPDPVDDGEPPLNPDPSRPYDPTEPGGGADPWGDDLPVPCVNVATGATGFIDPETGECVTSGPPAGDPGSPPPGWDPPPTGDPGPPPVPGDTGTQPPGGGGAGAGSGRALWPLAALAALLLTRDRRR